MVWLKIARFFSIPVNIAAGSHHGTDEPVLHTLFEIIAG